MSMYKLPPRATPALLDYVNCIWNFETFGSNINNVINIIIIPIISKSITQVS